MHDADLNPVPCKTCGGLTKVDGKACPTCGGLGFTYELSLTREQIMNLFKIEARGTATSRPPVAKEEEEP